MTRHGSLRLGRWMALGAAALVAAHASAEPTRTEVAFEGVGGLELKGTLVVPEGKPEGEPGARWPAVLLLPGSGPTDRDGNQPPALTTDLLKQFAERLAAERLAAEGVATLRFDKRAAPTDRDAWPRTPEALNAFFGWEAFVGDARAAYRYLRAREEVGSFVAIAGHSGGGRGG